MEDWIKDIYMNTSEIKPLSDAMLSVGQAYSIRDDILDIENDIKGKQKKIVYILAVQNTDEAQSKKLNEIYHKENITKNDIEEVKDIFNKTNALMIAEHLAKNLVEQARNYLKNIYPDLNKKQKVFFNIFSDFVHLREF